MYDGDLEQFCNDVSAFLRSVSDDLQPLDNKLVPDLGHNVTVFKPSPIRINNLE